MASNGDPNPNPSDDSFFNPLDNNDIDGFFFPNRSPCIATGGGVGGSGDGNGYSSITNYLQGFLVCDDGVKQEMVGRHDDLQMMAGGAPAIAPNSSSVLSSSSEAVGGSEHRRQCNKGRSEEIDDDEQGSPAADRNCKRRSKSNDNGEKKKKKARQPRVTFKTKSEVDHLEDGYRWRKYGQKAVKNSSYPRSYYRCTAARCGVKKLVERSQQDPSSVITTYEGQHTHPSPAGPAGARSSRVLLQQQQPYNNGFSPPMLGFIRPDDLAAGAMISRMAYASPPSTSGI